MNQVALELSGIGSAPMDIILFLTCQPKCGLQREIAAFSVSGDANLMMGSLQDGLSSKLQDHSEYGKSVLFSDIQKGDPQEKERGAAKLRHPIGLCVVELAMVSGGWPGAGRTQAIWVAARCVARRAPGFGPLASPPPIKPAVGLRNKGH